MTDAEQPTEEQLAAAVAKHREMRAKSFQALAHSVCMLSSSLAVTLVVTDLTGDKDGEAMEAQTQQFTVCPYGTNPLLDHMGRGAELIYEKQQEILTEVREAQEKAKQEAAESLPMPGEDDDPSDRPS